MADLGPWGPDRRVAVAVSGGADSMCLAWLASTWGKPAAYIADHGLRAEAGEEAETTARRLRGFGVPSRILKLRLPPGTALASRARQARYLALTQAAAADGLCDLLLGHHARDQAETVLIRRAAGSGPAGLSGMARLVETQEIRLVRPLLGVAAGRLRATLRHQGIGWAEDPSNTDPSATRSRIRSALDARDGQLPEVLAAAEANGIARAAQDGRIAAVLARRVSVFPQGYALLTPGPIEPSCLAALIRSLSGSIYPAATQALVRLAADPALGTLGGLRFMPAGRLGDCTLVLREAAAMQPDIAASDGTVWDGRFRLDSPDALPPGTTMGALGADARRFTRRGSLPACVLRTLPALRTPDGLITVPHLHEPGGKLSGEQEFDCGDVIGWTNRRARLTLCPSSPVAGASFCVSVLHDAKAGGARAWGVRNRRRAPMSGSRP